MLSHTLRAASIAAAIIGVATMANLPASAQEKATDKPASDAKPTAAAEENPIVGRANEHVIRRSDIVAAQRGLPQQYQNLPLDAVFPALLRQMINARLIADAARTDGLAEDPAVKSRLASLETRVLEQAYLERAIRGEVTEEKLRARYAEFAKTAGGEEEVRAAHILVNSKKEAEDIIAAIKKGESFAKLAREKSTGPSGKNGGELGYFGKGDMVKPFSDKAFSMKKGEVSDEPVKTQFGWHVIRVADKRQKPPPSFEQARDTIGRQVTEEIVTKLIGDLRDKGKVEEYNLDGTPRTGGGIQRVPQQ